MNVWDNVITDNTPQSEDNNTITNRSNTVYRDIVNPAENISQYPCIGTSTPANTYIDPVWNYSLVIPVSYITEITDTGLAINKYRCWDYEKGPGPRILVLSIVQPVLNQDKTYTDPVEYAKSRYTTTDYEKVKINPITLNGLRGAEIFLFSPGEEGYLDARILIFLKESRFYIIAYGKSDDLDYKKIAESLKFTD